MNERDVFLAALEIEDPEARRAHLEAACGDRAELLARVEALLASHEGHSRFLNTPVVVQMADDSARNPDPTVVIDEGSTEDEPDLAATIPHSNPATPNGQGDEMADEIPLGYLQPSTRPDSLGRLAHYEVLEVIGRGAFGTVLKAFDEKLHRVVAIKVLAPEMAATSPARKRFLREARASAAVRHENVVSIYAVEDDPTPYLVMEYIPGQTLEQRLNEHGPLDLPDVLRLGRQIADGLSAAHAQDLIHRDVKPGNILLETGVDDHVKITDFGLARTADDASMTQSGVIAGTPMYMAPEQAQGHKLDQRADLFSFGSVLYQMLSGRPPFRAPTTIAVLKRLTEDTPRPIQEIIPEVPDWMCEIVGHLHAKNPDERYGSAKEVSDLLAQCAVDLREGRVPRVSDPSKSTDHVIEATRDAVSEPRRPPRNESLLRSRLSRVAAVALILLIGLGLTEATGVTQIASTVIRLTTGSGTLVIETDDPGVMIAINGEEVTITGGGVEELTLRPGEYTIAALKDGKPVKQELVSISRNGRTVVRMSLEPAAKMASSESPKKGDGWHELPADAPPPAIASFDAEQAKEVKGGERIVEVRKLAGHGSTINDQAPLPDGVHVVSSSTDQKIIVWNAETGEMIRRFWVGGNPRMSLSPDGNLVATTTDDPITLSLWEVATGKPRWTVDRGLFGSYVDFSPDGRFLLVVASVRTKDMRVYRVDDGAEVWRKPYEAGWFAGGGRLILALDEDRRDILVLNAANGDLLGTLAGHSSVIHYDGFLLPRKHAILVDDARGHLYSGDVDGTVIQWDLENHKELRRFRTTVQWIRPDRLLDDGRVLLTRDGQHSLRLWDVETGKPICRAIGHTDLVVSAEALPGDRYFITGSKDKTIRLWEYAADLRSLRENTRVDSVGPFTSNVSVLADGKHVISCERWAGRIEPEWDHELHVWRLPESVWSENNGKLDSTVNATARPAAAPPPAIAPFDAGQAKAHQAAWAKYLGVSVEKEIVLGRDQRGLDVKLSLVFVPPGEFLMGSSDEEIAKLREQARANGLRLRDFKWIDLEGPQRRVQITRPFYISRTEVTNDQFRCFVEGTDPHYQTEAESSGKGSWTSKNVRMVLDPKINWRTQHGTGPTAPVTHVTWNDANACCQWLSGREAGLAFALPTEAQWEYACRAGTTTAWSCGDDDEVLKEFAIVNMNWYRWCGTKKPNSFGLYDMHGNVWEWCRDSISNYRGAETVDPVGPEGEKRIIRGGNCFGGFDNDWHNGNGCRSAVRYEDAADHRVLDKGFRVVAALPEDVLRARLSAEASAKVELPNAAAPAKPAETSSADPAEQVDEPAVAPRP